ncbi:thiopeptide-type bacteriocin biosynthesis protein [Aquimarina longa]|uniref:thiopeptide-type bacteriocin biosynthesis protein n=1 Tax=Aquimarina longa TaxID=1080221 RepID=UPI0007860177|nr:thiopeptide-type bacteriocin biosynthesis protein [Aquimarina longa]
MSVKRTYILGDEWLYYKIYCGARTSDVLLTETIKPLTEQLLEQGLIDSWFFIRYGDPDFHIRIRFHLPDIKCIGDVILTINKVLQQYVAHQTIYKIQTDTYIRELERYGTHTIDVSEQLFFYESVMLLEAIDIIEDEELYFLFILKAINSLLDSFHFRKEQKLDIFTRNAQAYKREFNADKTLNKQLDKKYRGLKNKLVPFLEPTTQEDYAVLDRLLQDKIENSQEAIQAILYAQQNNRLEIQSEDLLSSYIHMLVNRAFRSKQRFYELVCYDFLLRYQKTKMSYTVS